MRLSLLFIFALLLPASVQSAVVTVLDKDLPNEEAIQTGRCAVSLSGVIEAGDTEKLIAVIQEPHQYQEHGATVCLEGPGGSLKEAVRIARAIAERSVITIVPEGGTCLSACAVAFMGGTIVLVEPDPKLQKGPQNARYLHKSATLGFHAPALQIEAGRYSEKAVESAFVAATSALADIQNKLGIYLRGDSVMKFPYSLLGVMLNFHGNDFVYVDSVERAGAWGIGVIGAKHVTAEEENMLNLCVALGRWSQDLPSYDAQYLDDDWEGWLEFWRTRDASIQWIKRVKDGHWTVEGVLGLTCEIEQDAKGRVLTKTFYYGREAAKREFDSWVLRKPSTRLSDL